MVYRTKWGIYVKIVLSKKATHRILLFTTLCFAGILCINFTVFAHGRGMRPYETRSKLLMESLNSVGVATPKAAAEIWAQGVKKRNGALQYAAMTQKLRSEYEKQLSKNSPNWVTGMSSPWISAYQITEKQNTDKNQPVFEIVFSTATSTGAAGNYKATLTVIKEGEFWRVSKISADKGLAPYTSFSPA